MSKSQPAAPAWPERSHYCGDLRTTDLQKSVTVMGWVAGSRDHGGCVFIDLRDRTGIVQVVVDAAQTQSFYKQAEQLRPEWVIAVVGTVRSRGGNINPRLQTGDIEIIATHLQVLNSAETPPFAIADTCEAGEDVRLRYRYLDLRRPSLQANLSKRHRFNQVARATLDEMGFLELETPFLIKSTPEGARDYVVPSRVHPGRFFALPQSPQLFKQLFMIAGYDRYFQITRCFRDEDLRAERQPEFTQLDLEMSFCHAQTIQHITENILQRAFAAILQQQIPQPFPRMTYQEAMARYGTDAPDVRYGLTISDVSAWAKSIDFPPFQHTLASKGSEPGAVKAIVLGSEHELSRKDLDGLTAFCQSQGGRGLVWIKTKSDPWSSPIARYLTDEARAQLRATLDLQPGQTVFMVAEPADKALAVLGQLRKQLAKDFKLTAGSQHAFLWVTDFPLFDYDKQQQRLVSCHHPFTAPHADDVALLDSDPTKVRAQAYDVVLNGVEIGGGSLRIYQPEMQQKIFSLLGLSEAEAQEKFGFLLGALRHGAPPHGGLALGIDRIMMQICETPSIRDVIAFPKTQRQWDTMLEAPSPLDPAQLLELKLRLE